MYVLKPPFQTAGPMSRRVVRARSQRKQFKHKNSLKLLFDGLSQSLHYFIGMRLQVA